MTRAGLAVLAIEVAAGALVQATDLGGPVAIGIATGVVMLSAIYLGLRARPSALASKLRDFVDERIAGLPTALDQVAQREYALDTLACYRRRFERAVRARLRRLRKSGAIGPYEERRLKNPRNLSDIAQIAECLSAHDGLTGR